MIGVDIEPDDPKSILVDIVFRKCRFIDNNGGGVNMNLKRLDHDIDAPISILFEDCDVTWSTNYPFERGPGPQAGCFEADGYSISDPTAAGSITIRGGTVRGSAGPGISIVNKPLRGPTVAFVDVTLVETARIDQWYSRQVPMPWMHVAPIRMLDNAGGIGGVWFENVHVIDSVKRPFLRYYHGACAKAARGTKTCPNVTEDIRGSIIVNWGASPDQCNASLMSSPCIQGHCQPHILPEGRIFGRRLLSNLSVSCVPLNSVDTSNARDNLKLLKTDDDDDDN